MDTELYAMFLRLQAQTLALMIATRLSLPPDQQDQFTKLCEEHEKRIHDNLLVAAENCSPEIAARLDDRTPEEM